MLFKQPMSNQTEGYFSLSDDINRVKDSPMQDGPVGMESPLLTLELPDDQLVEQAKKWEDRWTVHYANKLKKKQDSNDKYWKGTHFRELEAFDDERTITDNVLFEALETFLPIATKQNPEAVVIADNTVEGNSLADKVASMLNYLGDNLSLRLKLKNATRHWALYYVGVLKVGWSEVSQEISIETVRPQKMILDPDSTIDCGMYTGEYTGEYRRDTAENLTIRFPEKKEFIEQMVNGKMGTFVQYIEWWTNDYVFWTLKDEVLAKAKNPHWNYAEDKTVVDEYGQESTEEVPGRNHFKNPQIPYIFISVFNTGIHPYDDTNLMEQNQRMQDRINRRSRQIDQNADNTNGGAIVSGDHFTKEGAADVGEALRRGDTIFVPSGDVNMAYRRDMGPPLPSFMYQDLVDSRNELRNIFGTQGSSAAGLQQDRTVRGKLLSSAKDTDRIGGGITEYIEAAADLVFNYWTQLMMVYYDEPHMASIIGQERAAEVVMISSQDFDRRLTVTVKEGSLLPKDSFSKRQEAVELASAGLLDPITLYERLDFPNPRDAAKRLVMFKIDPLSIFPELATPQGPPGMPGPAVSQGAPGVPGGVQPPNPNVPGPPVELPQIPN